MTKTKFSFTDTKKDVLKSKEEDKPASNKKNGRMGRPKVTEKRNNKIICYFSDDEYQEVKAFLDGRPASVSLRTMILDHIRDSE